MICYTFLWKCLLSIYFKYFMICYIVLYLQSVGYFSNPLYSCGISYILIMELTLAAFFLCAVCLVSSMCQLNCKLIVLLAGDLISTCIFCCIYDVLVSICRYPWILLIVFQLLMTNVSLLGHLCGILSGFSCMHLPVSLPSAI